MMKSKIPMDLVSGFIGIFFICVVIVDLYFVVISLFKCFKGKNGR